MTYGGMYIQTEELTLLKCHSHCHGGSIKSADDNKSMKNYPACRVNQGPLTTFKLGEF